MEAERCLGGIDRTIDTKGSGPTLTKGQEFGDGANTKKAAVKYIVGGADIDEQIVGEAIKQICTDIADGIFVEGVIRATQSGGLGRAIINIEIGIFGENTIRDWADAIDGDIRAAA